MPKSPSFLILVDLPMPWYFAVERSLTRSMRICLYTETALPKLGGQELVVDALAKQFNCLGHSATVLAARPRRPLRTLDSKLPYTVHRHPRFISTRRMVSWYAHWLRRLHRRQPFDVLHCHSVYPCGYLAALCRAELPGVVVVITSHGGDVRQGNARLRKPGLTERHVQSLESADQLVSISRFTRDGFLRLCPSCEDRITDLPNGVDYQTYQTPVGWPADHPQSAPDAPYLLFLGRLSRRKGVDVLLDALASLPIEERPPLVVAGGGDQRGELERQAQSLGLVEQVRFVGPVTGAAKVNLLQNARCLVAASRGWEAFPLTVLESYAAACPVIGTAIPGLGDLIQHEQTGLLVESESKTQLAAAIKELFQHPSKARQLGQSAQSFAAEYRWQSIAQRHLQLYDRLLNQRRQQRAA